MRSRLESLSVNARLMPWINILHQKYTAMCSSDIFVSRHRRRQEESQVPSLWSPREYKGDTLVGREKFDLQHLPSFIYLLRAGRTRHYLLVSPIAQCLTDDRLLITS